MYQYDTAQQQDAPATSSASPSSAMDFGSNAARQDQISAYSDSSSVEADSAAPGLLDELALSLNPKAYELEQLLEKETLTSEEVTRARELIEAMPPWSREEYYLELQEKTAYHNQRDSKSTQENVKGGTCNLTAVAMALEMLGVPNPDPSLSFEDYLVKKAEQMRLPITKRDTWKAVVATLNPPVELIAVFEEWGKPITRAQWESIRDDHLGKGRGVVLSHSRHVVRIQAINEEGVVVDDPYGAMPLRRGGGLDYSDKDEDGNPVKNGRQGSTGEAAERGNDNLYPWADLAKFPIGAVYAFDFSGASGSPFEFVDAVPEQNEARFPM